MTISNCRQHRRCIIKCTSKFPLLTSLVWFGFQYYGFHNFKVFRRYIVPFNYHSFYICNAMEKNQIIIRISFVNYENTLPFNASQRLFSVSLSSASNTAAPTSKYVNVHTIKEIVRTFCFFILHLRATCSGWGPISMPPHRFASFVQSMRLRLSPALCEERNVKNNFLKYKFGRSFWLVDCSCSNKIGN